MIQIGIMNNNDQTNQEMKHKNMRVCVKNDFKNESLQ